MLAGCNPLYIRIRPVQWSLSKNVKTPLVILIIQATETFTRDASKISGELCETLSVALMICCDQYRIGRSGKVKSKWCCTYMWQIMEIVELRIKRSNQARKVLTQTLWKYWCVHFPPFGVLCGFCLYNNSYIFETCPIRSAIAKKNVRLLNVFLLRNIFDQKFRESFKPQLWTRV